MANINTNVPETMIPGSYASFNYYAGPNGLPANIQKILLVGDVSSEGTLAVNAPTGVFTEAEATKLAGAGSVLHQMYIAAKKAWKYAQITLLRHAAPNGTAASWSIELTGNSDGKATKAGLARVMWNGRFVEVAVANGEHVNAIAEKIAEAIANKVEAPFTATAEDGVVTLAAKCKGAYISNAKGGVVVSVATEGTDIVVGEPALTAGTGSVSIEDALDSAFAERFQLIVSPVADSTNLGYLKTHVRAAAEPLEQRGQRGIACCVVDTVKGATDIAASLNHERICLAAIKNEVPAFAWEVAAGMASIFASNSKPNIPMNGDKIPGVGVPSIEDKWSGEEQDGLMYGGCIPLVEADGELSIVRAVTTKTSDNGVRFEKLVDTGVIATLDYFRDSIVAMHKIKYQKKVIHALLPDALNEDNIAIAKALEDEQLLRNVNDYESAFMVQESPTTPGRLLCAIPAPVVPGLNQIYSTIELFL